MMRLYPFQLEGAAHLQSERVRLLADDMGLGKTAQAIRATEDHGQPVTVLAPAILLREWQDEIARWADVPRDVAIIGAKGGPDPRHAAITLCSYDRSIREHVYPVLWSRARRGHLIFDECHALKEPGAKRSQAALGSRRHPGLVAHADRVSFLTGTPIPNHAGELYGMLKTAGRVDGSWWDFMHQFCVVHSTPFGEKVTGYKDKAGLCALLDGFMLRRTNVVELPPTERGEILVEPDAAADPRALEIVSTVDAQISDMIKRAAEAGDFDRLETPHLATLRRAVGLAKAHAVGKLAAELLASNPTAKIVLFCIHRDVIAILLQALREFRPVQLVGGDSDKKRKALKDRFQSDPETRAAVCQIRAAGVGLTLTAANHLWLVEPSWTPADNDQAEKRILRLGQTRKTSVKLLTLVNSIDEAVNRVLRKKRQLIDEIML